MAEHHQHRHGQKAELGINGLSANSEAMRDAALPAQVAHAVSSLATSKSPLAALKELVANHSFGLGGAPKLDAEDLAMAVQTALPQQLRAGLAKAQGVPESDVTITTAQVKKLYNHAMRELGRPMSKHTAAQTVEEAVQFLLTPEPPPSARAENALSALKDLLQK